MRRGGDPAWYGQLVAEWFARGPGAQMVDVARVLKRTPEECERALKTPACQAQVAVYQQAVRQRLVAQRVAPMQELQQWGHEAARGLVAAMWLAAERENVRELRECSSAILNYLGHTPVKRTDKTVTHKIDAIQDPVLLARIIESADPEAEMAQIDGR